jgi:dTDP-4-amino-4,6-dideoxygalactose transaminase
MQSLFQQRHAYPGSHFPFDLSDAYYERGLCPVAEDILRTAITMPVSEFYTPQDVEDIVRGVRKVACHYASAAHQHNPV